MLSLDVVKLLVSIIFITILGCAGPSTAPKALYLQYLGEVSPDFQSKITYAIGELNKKAGYELVSLTEKENRRPLVFLKVSSSEMFAHAEYLDYRCLIQIDDSNTISNNSSNNYLDLQYILLHEIGHCYGFQHVSDTTNVMYPDYTGTQVMNASQISALISKMSSFLAQVSQSL